MQQRTQANRIALKLANRRLWINLVARNSGFHRIPTDRDCAAFMAWYRTGGIENMPAGIRPSMFDEYWLAQQACKSIAQQHYRTGKTMINAMRCTASLMKYRYVDEA